VQNTVFVMTLRISAERRPSKFVTCDAENVTAVETFVRSRAVRAVSSIKRVRQTAASWLLKRRSSSQIKRSPTERTTYDVCSGLC
jgi:hypothetical protein